MKWNKRDKEVKKKQQQKSKNLKGPTLNDSVVIFDPKWTDRRTMAAIVTMTTTAAITPMTILLLENLIGTSLEKCHR